MSSVLIDSIFFLSVLYYYDSLNKVRLSRIVFHGVCIPCCSIVEESPFMSAVIKSDEIKVTLVWILHQEYFSISI